jgi:cell division protein FtsB
LAAWRARALKAEGDARGARGGRGGRAADAEARVSLLELEAENRALRQRLDAARARVADLVGRLEFLEEQARVGVGGGT